MIEVREHWRVPALPIRRGLSAATWLLAGSCSPASEPGAVADLARQRDPTGLQVCVVGLDGTTREELEDLARTGRIPNLGRMLAFGSCARLRGEPETSTAPPWTDLVTGKERSWHGIDSVFRMKLDAAGDGGFLAANRLSESLDRRCLALWNILEGFELSCGVVGLPATAPAEAFDGFMVSEAWFDPLYASFAGDVRASGLVHPGELEPRIAPLRFEPAQLPVREVEALYPMDETDRELFARTRRPLAQHWATYLKYGVAVQRGIEETVLALLESRPRSADDPARAAARLGAPWSETGGQPDLLLLNLPALLLVGQALWHDKHPKACGRTPSSESERRAQVFGGLLEHADRFLGRLQQRLDPETVWMVVCTQGLEPTQVSLVEVPAGHYAQFRAPKLATTRITLGHSGEPDGRGFLLCSGGPCLPGGVAEATLPDVTASVLALLGLPLARDLRGRVLEECFDPRFFERHPLHFLDTFEGRIPAR